MGNIANYRTGKLSDTMAPEAGNQPVFQPTVTKP
jgi:hypothetical protein